MHRRIVVLDGRFFRMRILSRAAGDSGHIILLINQIEVHAVEVSDLVKGYFLMEEGVMGEDEDLFNEIILIGFLSGLAVVKTNPDQFSYKRADNEQ